MNQYAETNFIKDYKPGADAVVELKNGRLVDVVNGRYFEAGVGIVVTDGKIAAMPGLSGESREMKPDFTIDLKGRTVLPGIFNTHCHVQMKSTTLLAGLKDIKVVKKYGQEQLVKNMNECLAHGITNIRDAMTDDLHISRVFTDRISKGEIDGPRILQSVCVTQPDGYMSQKAGLMMRVLRSALGMPILDFDDENSGIVVFPLNANEKQVRDAVDRAIDERGAEAIKLPEQRMNMNTFIPDLNIMTIRQFQALTDQAAKRGVQSTMHQITIESFRRGIEGGISSFAHMARDGALSEEDLDAFIAADCIVEPTLSVGYDMSWKIEGDEWRDHPNIEMLSHFRDKTYTFSDLADEYYVPEMRASVKNSYDKFVNNRLKLLGLINMAKMVKNYSSLAVYAPENIKRLFKKGARMALANDGGVPPCTPAMMALELALFELFLNSGENEKLFTGADAVKIATINSAHSMGLEEKFGSLETGKTADLAIVDGDPFEDFRVVGSRVAALFMDGRLVIDNCGLEI